MHVELPLVDALVGYHGSEVTEEALHGVLAIGGSGIDLLCLECEIWIFSYIAIEDAFQGFRPLGFRIGHQIEQLIVNFNQIVWHVTSVL